MTQDKSMVYLAEHALQQLGTIIQQHQAERIFAVVDEHAAVASGASKFLDAVLSAYKVTQFSGFEMNPQLHDIERGIQRIVEAEPDLVIALGGGTALDLGKLISSIACTPASAFDIVTGRVCISRSGPPLVAIPTTAGTGSEATHFAVAYVDQTKYSVAHEFLLPAYAIIDPELTYSLPRRITAATGLDAFSQAIESIWAVGATDESIGYALSAAEGAWKYLADVVQRPTPESRMGMCRASHLAGKAINISKTTAPHAISYAFTSQHKIPHGIAVALTLSRMFAYNAYVTDNDCLDPRGAEHVRRRIDMIVKLLGASSVLDACQRIDQMIEAIECPNSPAAAGVTSREALQAIVDSVNSERMLNNPRVIDPAVLFQLLQ